MKRSLWLILILALSLLVLAGCDDDRPVAPTTALSQDAAQDKTITEDEAVDIALEHAGFIREEVSNLYVHLDRDDGKAYMEVEFRIEFTEYSYEINATTGEIVDFEKELDD